MRCKAGKPTERLFHAYARSTPHILSKRLPFSRGTVMCLLINVGNKTRIPISALCTVSMLWYLWYGVFMGALHDQEDMGILIVVWPCKDRKGCKGCQTCRCRQTCECCECASVRVCECVTHSVGRAGALLPFASHWISWASRTKIAIPWEKS